MVLGSVAESVVRMSTVPVLTVRSNGPGGGEAALGAPFRVRHIAAAVDFGESSAEALRSAVALAKAFSAPLTLLHVFALPEAASYGLSLTSAAQAFAPIQAAAKRELDRLLATVQAQLLGARGELRAGAPVHEIGKAIEDLRPDLLVLGTHGRRGFDRLRLGSVAARVVQSSPIPVLTVRQRHSNERNKE
jgi:nucleotide-binding universal stress UspA family protein